MHRFTFGEMKAEKYQQCVKTEALKAADELSANRMMKKIWLRAGNEVVHTVICPHTKEQHG